jgi:hypothetical protein
MIRIGFLSRVQPILWREDLRRIVKSMDKWKLTLFQFRVYHSTLSCNCKENMVPVLMVDVDRNSIEAGTIFSILILKAWDTFSKFHSLLVVLIVQEPIDR